MGYAIRCLDVVGSIFDFEPLPPGGAWLASYDPDANQGRGEARWSPDFREALHFDTAGEAMECWRRQSRVRPLRADGRPNRPLTAVTVEVLEV